MDERSSGCSGGSGPARGSGARAVRFARSRVHPCPAVHVLVGGVRDGRPASRDVRAPRAPSVHRRHDRRVVGPVLARDVRDGSRARPRRRGALFRRADRGGRQPRTWLAATAVPLHDGTAARDDRRAPGAVGSPSRRARAPRTALRRSSGPSACSRTPATSISSATRGCTARPCSTRSAMRGEGTSCRRRTGSPSSRPALSSIPSWAGSPPTGRSRSSSRASRPTGRRVVRGEDLLGDGSAGLVALAAWLGVRTDPEAIEEMRHPERSAYAALGPPSAAFGSDRFLRPGPLVRSEWSRPRSVDGPLAWRSDGRGFLPEVKRTARGPRLHLNDRRRP